MGYYEGQRENPCPRCGGKVHTLFISVTPISYSEQCDKCGTTEFTVEEKEQLGKSISTFGLEPFDIFTTGL